MLTDSKDFGLDFIPLVAVQRADIHAANRAWLNSRIPGRNDAVVTLATSDWWHRIRHTSRTI